MALLVPNIGELESLRYLINNNNHVLDREDNAPRDLILSCTAATLPLLKVTYLPPQHTMNHMPMVTPTHTVLLVLLASSSLSTIEQRASLRLHRSVWYSPKWCSMENQPRLLCKRCNYCYLS